MDVKGHSGLRQGVPMNQAQKKKLSMPDPEIYIVRYQGGGFAAALTNEDDAYELADYLDGLVDHVPFFRSIESAREDSNIEYEVDRVTNGQ